MVLYPAFMSDFPNVTPTERVPRYSPPSTENTSVREYDDLITMTCTLLCTRHSVKNRKVTYCKLVKVLIFHVMHEHHYSWVLGVSGLVQM